MKMINSTFKFWSLLQIVMVFALSTFCTSSRLFAQTFSPSTTQVVPDSRKPGRTIKPIPQAGVNATQSRDSQSAATVTANESIFSRSTRFLFEMQPANHPRLPSPEQLMQTRVNLYKSGSTFSGSPSSNGVEVNMTLAELEGSNGSITSSARVAIQTAIVSVINKAGVGGVACLIKAAQTEGGVNTIKVVAAQIGSVRTIATGDRGGEKSQSTNDQNQATVKGESPISDGDLLETEVLEEYLFSLNRFPGRTVSAAVTSEPSSAQVVLDYFVQEEKIFDVYGSVSNTGTKETSLWQQRIGILATQLSNNDDILAIEYQTASFTDNQSVNGYYDARVGTMKNLRWRVTGQWSQYQSSDVGLAGEDFMGNTWGVQADLIWNFYQKGNFFLDFDGSARIWNSQVTNELLVTDASATFLTVSGTIDALALGDTGALQGSIGVAYTGTNANQETLDDLGRTNTSESWITLNGSVYGSFYLDPFLNSSWGRKTNRFMKPMAHEIFGSVRGQYAFDNRLTPIAQYTMGGLYTVRGFEQSITAGDSALVGTLEYRLHIPQLFAPSAPTGSFPLLNRPFRWVTDSANNAGPDWDFVLSAFLDGGTVSNSDAFPFEVNTSMYSAGVGLDLTVLENFALSVDLGFALNSIEELDVQSGSSQLWFTASIVY